MKRLLATSFALGLAIGNAGMASAQDEHHDDHHDDHAQGGNHHWQKGGRIEHEDWDRGQPVDYHEHHLRRPPRGYEWRQVDGQYVMAAVATGVIASVIANAH